MATSYEDRIRDIRGALSRLQGKKARAAVEHDNAKSRLAEAKKALLDEFGVSTTEQAKTKLQQMRADLDRILESIETDLEEAGA